MEFRLKSFSGINEEKYIPVNSLKDFSQESIYKFMKYMGRDLYESEVFSTQPKEVKLSKIKKGKYNQTEFKSAVKTSIINHPASFKDYQAEKYIGFGKTKQVFDDKFDLIFKISKNGLIIPPEFDNYIFLLYTLSKYNNGNFDYRFVERGNNYPAPIITVPKTKEGIKELILALTEFLVSLHLFIGPLYKIYIIEEDLEQSKYFSVIEKVTSFIPTVTSLAYRLIALPIIKKRFELNWENGLKFKYSPQLIPNLIDYIKKNHNKELVVGDCSRGSYYLNITKGKDAKTIQELFKNPEILAKYNIVPSRKRCELDWWAYAALGIDNNNIPRDLIIPSDLDPAPAIFHEIGHFFVNNDKSLGNIQRASHRGIFTEEFISLVGFILGTIGSFTESAIPEVVSWITGFLLRYPTLQSEFMASYYGLQLMKKLGATEQDLDSARKVLKSAYSTYLAHTGLIASRSMYGRIGGEFGKLLS